MSYKMFNFKCTIIIYSLIFSLKDAQLIDKNYYEEIFLSDQNPIFTWTNNGKNSIKVSALKLGYQIQVDVKKLDLQSENEDYIIIKNQEDSAEDTALMFSYTITENLRYLFNSEEIFVDYISAQKNETNVFEIIFTRVGEAVTTTSESPSSSTTPQMPTAAPAEPSALTVYIYGQIPEKYSELTQLNTLKDAIKGMGTEFCIDYHCPLNSTISIYNVKIQTLEYCPFNWENYKYCSNLTFALPIVKKHDDNNDFNGYQLSRTNLKLMWDRYAEKYLNEIDLSIYSVPNIKRIVKIRIIVACSIIVLVVMVVIISKVILRKINMKKRVPSDKFAIISGGHSKRSSELSLRPHYLQQVPPLFNNDYSLYQNEKGPRIYAEFDDVNEEIDENTKENTSGVLNMNNINENEDAEA